MSRPVPTSSNPSGESNGSTQEIQVASTEASTENAAQLQMNPNGRLPKVEGTPTMKVQSS
jgi:hypothetical protein